jgi:integrase/recombinase XerD
VTDLAARQLPSSLAEYDSLAALTASWLWSFRDSEHTRAAYRRDIEHFAGWCANREPPLDPLTLHRPQIDAYAAVLANTPSTRTGKIPAPSSVARRLAAVSSWYDYLLTVDKVTGNPVAKVRRPRVDAGHTSTIGLSLAEAKALLAAARTDRYLGDELAVCLAGFLLDIGARVSELCGLRLADLGYADGHRTVKLRMKGGKTRTRAIPPHLSAALDSYLAARADVAGDVVFIRPDGQPLNRQEVARFVRRAAKKAGIPSADRITPHSFRHAWNTIARQAGASLEHRQHAMGHSDPRTTQRYDRTQESLDQDPSYLVARALTA